MGTKEKLIRRLKTCPVDFTFSEAETLLAFFAYRRSNKGKTSGSRVIFLSNSHPPILLHRPHPGNELKAYQVKELLAFLQKEGLV